MEIVEFYKPEPEHEEWARNMFGELYGVPGELYDPTTGRYKGLIELPREYGRAESFGHPEFIFGKSTGPDSEIPGGHRVGGVIECRRASLPPEKIKIQGLPDLGILPLPHSPTELYLIRSEIKWVALYLIPYWENLERGWHNNVSGEVDLHLNTFMPLEEKVRRWNAHLRAREAGKADSGQALSEAEQQKLFEEAWGCPPGAFEEAKKRSEQAHKQIEAIIDSGNYSIVFYPDESVHFMVEEKRGG